MTNRPSTAPPPRVVPRSARGWLLWAAVVAGGGLLLFCYRYLGALADGEPGRAAETIVEEGTGAFVWGLIFFPIAGLVGSRPLSRNRWSRHLPIYVVTVAVSALVATSAMWGLRVGLFRLFGLGAYDYGAMPMRYFMELPMQVIGFCMMVGTMHGVAAARAARQRELRAVQLEASLADARLRALRLQLQPHFLFNALHTISSTMYQDPAAADEMIEHLGRLLRASLATGPADEVPLGSELDLLNHFLALMRARFGERLLVSLDIEEAAARALVPTMLLQPLVENAARHGNATLLGRGALWVRAFRRDGRLVVEVEDDGPGPGAAATGSGPDGRDDAPRRGLGLSATAERLHLLYGPAASLQTGPGPRGGFLARVCLAWRTGGDPR